ncbi:variant erythrocyte surface antigen-1 family protein [Babesia caballi]|uniref:Variant erythrocyte surface antigen-1 family protein n=1 Tax=Babesia caballi TaxID=5871 RepID=A0AAV4LRY8_BABCB|nr:variant erythrocyte surface antigen-1 family protein [Babesia caballi]
MTHTSSKKLTDCPSNLKEAIDWVLRVTGKDGVDRSPSVGNIAVLAREVCKLLGSLTGAISRDVTGIIRKNEEYAGSGHDPISKLAEALRVFIGYDGGPRGTIEGTGIAMKPKSNFEKPYDGLEDRSKKNSDGYFFSCPRGATWLQDVQHAQVSGGQKEAEQLCAHILLGCMPILYYGLTYLYWQSSDDTSGVWKDKQFDGSHEGSRLSEEGALSEFMQAIGYQRTSLSKSKCGNVMKSVAKSLQDLNISKTGGYSEFLKQLESTAKPNLNTYAYSYPLYGLYYAAYEYFKSQYQRNNNIVYIQNMKSTLNSLSRYSGSYNDFKVQLQACLSQVKTTLDSGSSGHLPGSSNQEHKNYSGAPANTISSVGYVAGGIVGTAAVGTGVALATNVGGITTIVKGAIGMV